MQNMSNSQQNTQLLQSEQLPSLSAGSHCQVKKDVVIRARDIQRKQMLEEKTLRR